MRGSGESAIYPEISRVRGAAAFGVSREEIAPLERSTSRTRPFAPRVPELFMRCTEFVKLAALVVLAAGSAATHAGPESSGRAGKLSDAMGGILDCDLGEAGALAHEIDYAQLTLRPGRAVEFRRRVAQELQSAATLPKANANGSIPLR